MGRSCIIGFHLHHGRLPEIRWMNAAHIRRKEAIDMSGFPTMSPIFGVFFALAGLALAVILGLVLYPDKKKLKASSKESFKVYEQEKTA
jgi:hypothetical protein